MNTKDKRAKARRIRKEKEMTAYVIYFSERVLVFSTILLTLTIFWMTQFNESYIRKLEDINHINLQKEVSTERISVKEHFARYIASLPIPQMPETTSKETVATVEILQTSTTQMVTTNTNELAKRVVGMTPTIRTLNTSSYCSCEYCCGKTDGITASGEKVQAWHTVAAGKEYEIGTIIYIPALADKPNGGWFIVQDRGGAIKNGKLDIYLNTHEEALQYGRQMLECYIYEF